MLPYVYAYAPTKNDYNQTSGSDRPSSILPSDGLCYELYVHKLPCKLDCMSGSNVGTHQLEWMC